MIGWLARKWGCCRSKFPGRIIIVALYLHLGMALAVGRVRGISVVDYSGDVCNLKLWLSVTFCSGL